MQQFAVWGWIIILCLLWGADIIAYVIMYDMAALALIMLYVYYKTRKTS